VSATALDVLMGTQAERIWTLFPTTFGLTMLLGPTGAGQADGSSQRAFAQGVLLLLVLILAMLGLFGTLVVVRAIRRYRTALNRTRLPTPCDDVWAMHKLPADRGDDKSGDAESEL
jgi:hypothetical protein